VRLTAKVDYALRAVCALAAAPEGPMTSDAIAAAEGIPQRFLEVILRDLRRGGLVQSRRGLQGGHLLARPAAEVSIADVIRVVDGPLATVRSLRPEQVAYQGASAHLRDVWFALRDNERRILERISVQDVVSGELGEGFAAQLN